MSNIYVSQFKDLLTKYYIKQKNYIEQIEDNNKRFSLEYAEKENVKVREQQAQEYNRTLTVINDIYTSVRELLACASFVSVESLTADRMLFGKNSAFNLSADEVKAYVERYKDNYTMLRLIKDWITANDRNTKEHPAGEFVGIDIVLPADMLRIYKKFAEGAIAVVEKIYRDGTSKPVQLDIYADEKYMSHLFDMIGNGMKLAEYKNKRIPDTAKHIFDAVKLNGADPNYYLTR